MRRRLLAPWSCIVLLLAGCFTDRGIPDDGGDEDTANDPQLVQLCTDSYTRRAAILAAQCQCQVDQGAYVDLMSCLTASGGVAATHTCTCDTYGRYPDARAGLECSDPAQQTALTCLEGVTCTTDTKDFDACINAYFTAISTCAAPPKPLIGEVELTCNAAQPFECGSGETVPDTWTCDQNIDCDDGSDEMTCEDTFLCADQSMIFPGEYRCDGYEDCPDNSDEANCPTFMCTSGTVIPLSFRCNGIPDCCGGEDTCPDSSDELNCPTFECLDGTILSEELKCDGFPDCLDGDDELDCPSFMCSDGSTVPQQYECDYQPDCPLGDDEAACAPFSCEDGTTIAAKFACDGKQDCAFGEDESYCPFRCKDGQKIDPTFECDGVLDCPEGDDEVDCSNP